MPNIETLNLAGNLTILPTRVFAQLASLLALDRSHNTISLLPGNVLDGTPALQKQNNSLSEVAPQAFSKLGSLSTLSLNHNYLQVIPKNLFQDSPKLKEVTLYPIFADGTSSVYISCKVKSSVESTLSMVTNIAT